MRALALLLVAGCAVRTTTATPSELAAHARAFTTAGRAELIRTDGNVTVSADERVDVRLQEGDGLQRSETLTVRELVTGCSADGADTNCLARRVVDEPVLRHRERTFDSSRTATFVGLAGIGGIVGFCMAECQGDGDLERGLLYSAGFIGGMLLLGIVLFSLGPD